MQNQDFKDINKPAGLAGPAAEIRLTRSVEWIRKVFLRLIYLYQISSFVVLQRLVGGDENAASLILERLLRERLIKKVRTDLQLSGHVIKLTPSGVEFCQTELGASRGSRYNTSSQLQRHALVCHDLASQLYMCDQLLRHGTVGYVPEAAREVTKNKKYFDVVVMADFGRKIGIEIERTAKYDEALRGALARASCAVMRGEVESVVYVLKTHRGIERYEEVLEDDSLEWPPCAACKCNSKCNEEGNRGLSGEAILMSFEFALGEPDIWKGAE